MDIVPLSGLGMLLLAMQSPTSTPATPAYLSRADVVVGLVDGQPWTMTNTDGRNGRIRFNADGTGAIESPIRRRIRWTMDGNTFCMRLGFMLGTRCFQGSEMAAAFRAIRMDAPACGSRDDGHHAGKNARGAAAACA
jgi:hypothetical protein